jgi:hypothetical protein
LLTSVVRGQTESSTYAALEYDVASEITGCPDLSDFSRNVSRQLGYDPFRASGDSRVLVQIAPTKRGFEASIKWSDASGRWVGERQLRSQSPACDEIAANVAFAVAVQIQLLGTLAPAAGNANAAGAAPSGERTTEAAGTPNAGTPNAGTSNANPQNAKAQSGNGSSQAAGSASTSEATAKGARRKRFGFSLGLGPSLGLAIAPKATGIGRLFGRYRLDWLSLELGVDAALPANRTEADGSGFSLRRFAAGTAACGHIEPFAGCVTATLGRLEARGFGVDKRASPVGLFSQVGVRLTATYEFGARYFAAARVEGLMMPATWRVRLNERIVWTTPRIGGLIGLDLGLNFF